MCYKLNLRIQYNHENHSKHLYKNVFDNVQSLVGYISATLTIDMPDFFKVERVKTMSSPVPEGGEVQAFR